MVDPYRDVMTRLGYVFNTPEDIARVILGLAVGKHQSGKGELESCNGLAVLVRNGEGWEVEGGLDATMGLWLGPEAAEEQRPFIEYSLQR